MAQQSRQDRIVAPVIEPISTYAHAPLVGPSLRIPVRFRFDLPVNGVALDDFTVSDSRITLRSVDGSDGDFLYVVNIDMPSNTIGTFTMTIRAGAATSVVNPSRRSLADTSDTIYYDNSDDRVDTPYAFSGAFSRVFRTAANNVAGMASIGNTIYSVDINADALFSTDIHTGISTRVGNATRFGQNIFLPNSLAASGNTLYMISTDLNNEGLWIVDTTTGVASQVGNAHRLGLTLPRMSGLTFIGSTLYAVGVDFATDALYTINTTTSIATRVGSAVDYGVGISSLTGLTSIGNTLYSVDLDTDALYTINRTTGVATRVGNVDRFGQMETTPNALTSVGNTLYLGGSQRDLVYISNPVASISTITVDWNEPITSSLNPIRDTQIIVSLEFSEPIVSFSVSDIELDNDNVRVFLSTILTGSRYNLSVLLPDNVESSVLIRIPQGTVIARSDARVTNASTSADRVYFDTRPFIMIRQIPAIAMTPGQTPMTFSLDEYISGSVDSDGVSISGQPSWVTLGPGSGVNRTLRVAPPSSLMPTPPFDTFHFTLSATGSGGSDSITVYVYVYPTEPAVVAPTIRQIPAIAMTPGQTPKVITLDEYISGGVSDDGVTITDMPPSWVTLGAGMGVNRSITIAPPATLKPSDPFSTFHFTLNATGSGGSDSITVYVYLMPVPPTPSTPPPTIDVVPVQVVAPGATSTISIDEFVSGNVNNDGITISDNPSWVTISTLDLNDPNARGVNRTITIAPPSTITSSEQQFFTLTATGTGGSSSQQLTVYVDVPATPSTPAPDIDVIPVQVVAPMGTKTISVDQYVSGDVNADGVTISTAHSWITISTLDVDDPNASGVNRTITISPPGTITTSMQFEFFLHVAGSGGSSSQQISVYVDVPYTPPTPPPAISVIPVQVVAPMGTKTISVDEYVSGDVNADGITISTAHSWITISTLDVNDPNASGVNRTITISPPGTITTSTQFEFFLHAAGSGGSSSQQITVYVDVPYTPPTPPPTISVIPVQVVSPGSTATIALDEYVSGNVNADGITIADNESWITISTLDLNDPNARGVNRTITIAPPTSITTSTQYLFTLNATGSGGTSSQQVTVYVDVPYTPPTPPPTISVIPVQVVAPNATRTISVDDYVSGDVNNDGITISDEPSWVTISTLDLNDPNARGVNRTITIAPPGTITASEQFFFTLTATGSGGTTSQQVTIYVDVPSVVPTLAPIISVIPVQVLAPGETNTISVDDYVSGDVNNDGITIADNPSWVTISTLDLNDPNARGVNRTITIAPPTSITASQQFFFTLTATGSGGTTSQQVTVYVDVPYTPPTPPTPSPNIAVIPVQVLPPGDTKTISVDDYVSGDVNADGITIADNESWITISALDISDPNASGVNRTITISPPMTITASEQFFFTLNATGSGGSASQQVTVYVDVPTVVSDLAPNIAVIPVQVLAPGDTKTISVDDYVSGNVNDDGITISDNDSWVTISTLDLNDPNARGVNRTITIAPPTTITASQQFFFMLNATGSGGSASQQVTIYVDVPYTPPTPPTPPPNIDPIPVVVLAPGETDTISLDTYVSGSVNDDGITISGEPSWVTISTLDLNDPNARGVNRTITLAPPMTITASDQFGYTLSVVGSGGTTTQVLTVYVDVPYTPPTPPTPDPDPPEVIAWGLPNESLIDTGTVNVSVTFSVAVVEFVTADRFVSGGGSDITLGDATTNDNRVWSIPVTIADDSHGYFSIAIRRDEVTRQDDMTTTGPSHIEYSPSMTYDRRTTPAPPTPPPVISNIPMSILAPGETDTISLDDFVSGDGVEPASPRTPADLGTYDATSPGIRTLPTFSGTAGTVQFIPQGITGSGSISLSGTDADGNTFNETISFPQTFRNLISTTANPLRVFVAGPYSTGTFIVKRDNSDIIISENESWITLSDGETINRTITISPPTSITTSTQYDYLLTVGGTGGITRQTLSVYVDVPTTLPTPPTPPPAISPIPVQILAPGQTSTLNLAAFVSGDVNSDGIVLTTTESWITISDVDPADPMTQGVNRTLTFAPPTTIMNSAQHAYTISATGAGGTTSHILTVYVDVPGTIPTPGTPPPVIAPIPINVIAPGGTATIALDSFVSGMVNDDGIAISGEPSWVMLGAGMGVNRTITLSPPTSITTSTQFAYTLTATGPGGSATQTLTVYVDVPASIPVPDTEFEMSWDVPDGSVVTDMNTNDVPISVVITPAITNTEAQLRSTTDRIVEIDGINLDVDDMTNVEIAIDDTVMGQTTITFTIKAPRNFDGSISIGIDDDKLTTT